LAAQRVSRAAGLPDATRASAETVLARRGALFAAFDDLLELDSAGLRIRVHGDYHLGQVLRVENDFVILDFEGEPARSIGERRAKQSPLKDVAGMLRSYSYAAYAALFMFTVHAPDDLALLRPWAETWRHWTSEAFVGGYREVMDALPQMPHRAFGPLLRAFAIEKALYELAYELNARPDWVRIPLIGIRSLIGDNLA
jgi:maltose alpha-D-glucosyltransferase/alpha-amylase